MLIEETELTLSHVDLGALDEPALLALFGNAHCHRLTRGCGSITDIVDTAGTRLYPGYYWTHLRIPTPLARHRVWDRVAVGVDVRAFGGMLLTSSYALGRPGELGPDPAIWDRAVLPTMEAANAFYRPDGSPGTPRPGSIAELPRLTAAPAALARFREVRERSAIDPGFRGELTHEAPIPYRLIAGRDLRAGHGVMFARWTLIADCVERELLAQRLSAPPALVPLERETFYFANVAEEGALRAQVAGTLAGGEWNAIIEISDERGALLVASRVRKAAP